MVDDPEQTGGEPEEDDAPDRVEEQELESFPASDPHSDWSGPAS